MTDLLLNWPWIHTAASHVRSSAPLSSPLLALATVLLPPGLIHAVFLVSRHLNLQPLKTEGEISPHLHKHLLQPKLKSRYKSIGLKGFACLLDIFILKLDSASLASIQKSDLRKVKTNNLQALEHDNSNKQN